MLKHNSPPRLPPNTHIHIPPPKPKAPNTNGHAQSEVLPHVFKHGDPDERPLVDWTIRDLVSRRATVLVSGPSHVGKTALLMDAFAAMMIGPGATLATKPVVQRYAVLLLAAEAPEQVRVRLEGEVKAKIRRWYEERGEAMPHPLPFYWVEDVPRLTDPGGWDRLQAIITAVQRRSSAEHDLDLGMIAIDTVSAAADFDHDNTQQTVALMNNINAIKNTLNIAIWLTDHFGKAGRDRGTKGNTAKEERSDTVLYCYENAGYEFYVKKVRLSKSKWSIPYILDAVDLGVDEDGGARTSVVLRWPVEAKANDPLSSAYPKRRRGRPNELTPELRTAVNRTVNVHGQRMETKSGRRNAVYEEQVFDEFKAHAKPDGEKDQKKHNTAVQRRFRDACAHEETAQVIGFERQTDGRVVMWLIHENNGK